MPESTTITVSVRTRDALRLLADREGLTYDAQLERMIRRERRRIMGAHLANAPPDADDEAVLDASAGDVAATLAEIDAAAGLVPTPTGGGRLYTSTADFLKSLEGRD